MFPIRSTIIKSNHDYNFFKLYSWCMILVNFLYILFGFINFLGLRDNVKHFVFYNYLHTNILLTTL